ncbi:uncharacterized protein LOC141600957 [Silene latifolia]|uniref:uncharacterized protein LOC141600957 n=1 Tax=Silene latifolia TaxID=37657 RepID=UPI003D774AE0
MIPKLHATYFVVAKEYVPNKSFSVERDTGIYMMRHMETYNGNKCRYTLKLLKDALRLISLYIIVRGDVKRYIVRVCNEILTWQDNIVKDQVTSKAKAYKNGCVIRNEVPRDLPYTDEHLMNFIRTNVANKDDIVVDTPWLQVTQEGMSTLFGGKWIMDMVIDLVGLRLTLERPNLVYFPTIIKDVVAKNSFQSQYIKLQYLPKSLTKAKLAFFPYCVDREHWFACMSDFVKKTNFILDSNLPRRPRHKM